MTNCPAQDSPIRFCTCWVNPVSIVPVGSIRFQVPVQTEFGITFTVAVTVTVTVMVTVTVRVTVTVTVTVTISVTDRNRECEYTGIHV